MTELTDNDQKRIKQEARHQTNDYYQSKLSTELANDAYYKGYKKGAEYATIFERQQQQLPPDNETVEDSGGCYVAGSREVEAERTEKVTDLLAKVSEQEKENKRLKAERQEVAQQLQVRLEIVKMYRAGLISMQFEDDFIQSILDKFNHSKQ